MGSALVILDRLLEKAGTQESNEHVLEQASYAVDNVYQRILSSFEKMVSEVTEELGKPEYNASTDVQDRESNPMPSWVLGGKQANDQSKKILRLAYWKRETGIIYVILRMEVDSRERPTYYNLVLGARRRTKSEPIKMNKLRESGEFSVLEWFKKVLHDSIRS